MGRKMTTRDWIDFSKSLIGDAVIIKGIGGMAGAAWVIMYFATH